MQYFIYDNSQIKEVTDTEYDLWIDTEKHKYLLEDYSMMIDGNQYSVETMYLGAIDKGEEVLPFVVFYFEDIYQIFRNGIKVDHDNDTIEYFATYEEMKKHRETLIENIKSKIPQD